MILEKKEQGRFRQYLLPFSSECCMFPSIKLTFFLSFCVGVIFGVLCQRSTQIEELWEQGGEGEYLM
jgi:hypothetical protein